MMYIIWSLSCWERNGLSIRGKPFLEAIQHRTPLFLQRFKMGRGQSGHFLELRAEMRHTTVVQLVCDRGQCKLVIYKKLLYTFNFMVNHEFFDGSALYFRKKISKIGIIVVEFFS